MADSNTPTKGTASAAAKPYQTREPYCKVTKIAEHLDVHRRTVELWARSGKIPYLKAGKSIRFKFSEVMAALER